MRNRWTIRVVLVALILLECCFLFAAFSDSHLDKPGTASAWFEWRRNPTPATQAAWDAERTKLQREQMLLDVVIWSLIIATGAAIYFVAKRLSMRGAHGVTRPTNS